jgi:hypothetical protein
VSQAKKPGAIDSEMMRKNFLFIIKQYRIDLFIKLLFFQLSLWLSRCLQQASNCFLYKLECWSKNILAQGKSSALAVRR